MSRRFFALLILAVLGWVPACLHNRASAQAEPAWCNASLDDVHTLAVAAHHEAGDSIADSAAIHRVLRTLAEGRGYSFGVMARRYMPHAFAGMTSRSSWSLALGPWCEAEPAAHPSDERRWSASEREWFNAWVAAERVLAGKHRAVCDGTIHDWGSPAIDRPRAARLGLIPVECES